MGLYSLGLYNKKYREFFLRIHRYNFEKCKNQIFKMTASWGGEGAVLSTSRFFVEVIKSKTWCTRKTLCADENRSDLFACRIFFFLQNNHHKCLVVLPVYSHSFDSNMVFRYTLVYHKTHRHNVDNTRTYIIIYCDNNNNNTVINIKRVKYYSWTRTQYYRPLSQFTSCVISANNNIKSKIIPTFLIVVVGIYTRKIMINPHKMYIFPQGMSVFSDRIKYITIIYIKWIGAYIVGVANRYGHKSNASTNIHRILLVWV